MDGARRRDGAPRLGDPGRDREHARSGRDARLSQEGLMRARFVVRGVDSSRGPDDGRGGSDRETMWQPDPRSLEERPDRGVVAPEQPPREPSRRGLENLVSSDRGVSMYRRMIRKGIEAVSRGEDPKGVLRTANGRIPTYANEADLHSPTRSRSR